jgi:hypothetical protein
MKESSKNDRLGQALRAHYRAERPSPRVMRRLDDATRAARPVRRIGWLAAIAAAAVGMAIATWLGLGYDPTKLAHRIADEVAMNHQKALELEFHGDRYAELDVAMDKLEFSLRRPDAAVHRDLTLLGGRYCSIQGQLAAQLRLEREDGSNATLYLTRLTRDLRHLPPQTLESRGIQVTLWQEADRFLALARTRVARSHTTTP